MKKPVLFPPHHTLEGHIVINGTPICTSVEMHLGDAGLSVQENSRFKRALEIRCFTSTMRRAQNYERLGTPMHFKFEGSYLGAYWQSFSPDPREPDTDIRIIRTLELGIEYSFDCVRYKFAGVASMQGGQVKPRLPVNSPSGDWEFSGQFFIPPERLREVYGLNDTTEPLYREAMQKLPRATWSHA